MRSILLTLHFLLFLLFAFPIRAQLVDESEPNNAFSTADSILLGKSYQGLLFPENDDDYYRVNIVQQGGFSARVSNVAADLLIRMKLYDSNFSEIDYRNGELGQTLRMDTEICDTGTYFLRVYALEQNPQIKYNLVAELDSSQSMSCLTSISEKFPRNPGLRFYPNPASDFLVIELDESSLKQAEPLFLRLYTKQGKRILRKRMNEPALLLQLPKIEKGIYLLELQTDRGIYFEKILVNNP